MQIGPSSEFTEIILIHHIFVFFFFSLMNGVSIYAFDDLFDGVFSNLKLVIKHLLKASWMSEFQHPTYNR